MELMRQSLFLGMAAFLPKYLESQFDLSPGDAAITVGIIVVPGGVGGTLLGGYLMKRFGLDRTAPSRCTLCAKLLYYLCTLDLCTTVQQGCMQD